MKIFKKWGRSIFDKTVDTFGERVLKKQGASDAEAEKMTKDLHQKGVDNGLREKTAKSFNIWASGTALAGLVVGGAALAGAGAAGAGGTGAVSAGTAGGATGAGAVGGGAAGGMATYAPLVQGAVGAGQLIAGASMKVKRPKYSIPSSSREALSTSRALANSSLRPGNDQAVSQIKQNTANTVDAMKSVSGNTAQLMSGVRAASNQEQKAIQNNNALNAQYSYNARLGLTNQLNNFAGFQDRAWDFNEFQPYQNKAATKSALIGSGMQNMWKASESAQGSMYGGGQNPYYGSQNPYQQQYQYQQFNPNQFKF